MKKISILYRFGIRTTSQLTIDQCDALVILSLSDKATFTGELEQYRKYVDEQKKYDAKFNTEGGLILLPDTPFKRLIYSPIGQVNRDYDDIRNFADVAVQSLSHALKSGSRSPLVVIPNGSDVPKTYSFYDLAIVLGLYQILYIPLENREFKINNKLDCIGFTNFQNSERKAKILSFANAIESGRAVARDIGGSDPERMSAPNVAFYVESLFKDSAVKVEVISDLKVIEKEFPCLGIFF